MFASNPRRWTQAVGAASLLPRSAEGRGVCNGRKRRARCSSCWGWKALGRPMTRRCGSDSVERAGKSVGKHPRHSKTHWIPLMFIGMFIDVCWWLLYFIVILCNIGVLLGYTIYSRGIIQIIRVTVYPGFSPVKRGYGFGTCGEYSEQLQGDRLQPLLFIVSQGSDCSCANQWRGHPWSLVSLPGCALAETSIGHRPGKARTVHPRFRLSIMFLMVSMNLFIAFKTHYNIVHFSNN